VRQQQFVSKPPFVLFVQGKSKAFAAFWAKNAAAGG
jgi:hypothetical protein